MRKRGNIGERGFLHISFLVARLKGVERTRSNEIYKEPVKDGHLCACV